MISAKNSRFEEESIYIEDYEPVTKSTNTTIFEKNVLTSEEVSALLKSLNSTIANASRVHQNYVNNLVDMMQNLPQDNPEESEKKMNFMFKQLYSLENLLANTKNELVKLENSLKGSDKIRLEDLSEDARRILTEVTYSSLESFGKKIKTDV